MTCLYKAGTDLINKIAHWQLAPLRQIKASDVRFFILLKAGFND